MSFISRTYLQNKTLFISAGHSNSDPGASGNGFTESNVVMDFRNLVAIQLRRRGIVFAQDGEREKNLPLSIAVQAAKLHDVAVEFHCNAADSSSATGVETLSHPDNFPLGVRLCQAVAEATGLRNRGAKDEAAGQHSRLAFVSDGGGVILELFFLSNREDLVTFIENEYEIASKVADVLAESVSEVKND